ncbi:MAG TPA: hypothetical protein VJ183_05605 [Chloroflexia bacterium]|nr:hypothetical protein [Chloroflexia bacterium]
MSEGKLRGGAGPAGREIDLIPGGLMAAWVAPLSSQLVWVLWLSA